MLTVFSANGPSGYRIANSLRFRSSASAYLNRTPSVAGNRKTWTWSAWVKRGSLGANSYPFACAYAASDSGFLGIYFNSDDTLAVSGFNTYWRKTTQVFRDPSAWYHIVVAFDTTQATGANRVKMYINGVQVTAFGTSNDPTLNTDYPINNNQPHFHSCYSLGTPTNFFDGYMAEINFIDGQALTPSSFGAFDATSGVWQPTRYSGTYGTNGFYLKFTDTTSTTTLCYDYSGNSNNWTPNNISLTAGSTYDSMLDSPTNYDNGGTGVGNYAVLNPLDAKSTIVPTNGNLTTTFTSSTSGKSSSIVMISGKWYWEWDITGSGGGGANYVVQAVGIVSPTAATNNLFSTGVAYYSLGDTVNSQKIINGAVSNYGTYWGNAGTYNLGVALDLSLSTITFYLNGISQGSITLPSNPNGWVAVTTSATGTGSCAVNTNFGQRPFAYTPPTGFKALNTQNLPVPSIQNGSNFMAATLYTGNGATQSIVNANNSVSFQPDLIWGKDRSSAYDNTLIDSIRGVGKELFSNSTSAENNNPGFNVTAFNSNGFALAVGNQFNRSGDNYVAWQWKAGGTAVTNTAGSITSSVSANTTSGFSVVTYTGTGSAATIGHGLGVAPSMVFIKARSLAGENWIVGHVSLPSAFSSQLNLNSTAAYAASSNFNSTNPTASVFSIGSGTAVNSNTNTYVAYCFAAIPGYSAFGSYTGNGSADGPFVYCGFRPRFVMVKRTDSSGAWVMYDSNRLGYNEDRTYLQANSSSAEVTDSGAAGSWSIDLISNGFKLRASSEPTVNPSGGTMIYAAFAENPFKYSLAR